MSAACPALRRANCGVCLSHNFGHEVWGFPQTARVLPHGQQSPFTDAAGKIPQKMKSVCINKEPSVKYGPISPSPVTARLGSLQLGTSSTPPIPNPAISGTALGMLQHCFRKRLGQNSILLQSFPPQDSEVTRFMSRVPTPPLQAPCPPPPHTSMSHGGGVRMPHPSSGGRGCRRGAAPAPPGVCHNPEGSVLQPGREKSLFFPGEKTFWV